MQKFPVRLHWYAGSLLALFLLLPAGLRADAPIELHLALHKGDVHHVQATLEQTIDVTVHDGHQQTKQTIAVDYTLSVDNVDAKGISTLSVKYDSVAFHAQSGAGAVEYDSKRPPGEVPPMASGFAAIVGQGYAFKINSTGEITEVLGLNKMLDAVLGRLTLPEGVARKAAENAIRQQLNEQKLRQSLQNLFAPLPDRPVAIGQSWARTAKLSLGFPMTVESAYTLQSIENGVATIKVEGNAITPPDAALETGAGRMLFSLKGQQTGSMKINASTGWTQTSEISNHLTGSATVPAPAVDPQTVPVMIDSKTTIEQK